MSSSTIEGFLDNLLEGCQVVGPDWTYLYVNSAVAAQGRSTKELLLGRTMVAVYPGIEDTEMFAVLRRCMEERAPQTMENEFVYPDGTRGWFELRFEPVPEGVLILSTDITERKRAEDARRESEERYRTVADHTYDWEYWRAPDGTFLYVSPSCERITGYRPEEFIDNPKLMASLAHPDDLDRFADHLLKSSGDEPELHDVDVKILTKSGEERWIAHACQRVYGKDGTYLGHRASNHDITERKRAEENLAKSVKRWQSTFDAITDIVCVLSPAHEFLEINAAGCQALGLAKEQIIGRKCFELVHRSNAPIAACPCHRSIATGLPGASEYEDRGRTFSLVAWPTLDADGKVVFLTHIIRDITEGKLAEEKLARSFETEAALKALLGLSLEGGTIDEFLGRALNLVLSLEWLAIESKGAIFLFDEAEKTLKLHVHKNFPESLLAACSMVPLGRCLCGRAAATRSVQFVDQVDDRHEVRYPGIQPHGHYCVPIVSGDHVLGVINLYVKEGHTRSPWEEEFLKAVANTLCGTIERARSFAEREKLEGQLRTAQKMDAIGSLAGGVAHDFNNLLSVILSYTGFALESLRGGDPLRDDLLEVKKAGERAAVLVRQLLAFGRKQLLEPRALNLNQITGEIEKMLRRILGEDIDFVQHLAPDLGLTLADPGQIEQVLMNLVVNARDAMPGGGKLTIETTNVELDETYTSRHMDAQPGSFVMLSVTDTGHGMDEQTRARIFEPFFTTKDKGKGTGLGLSMVYGIVKQSGGNIHVYSEPGQGTTFKIYLPRKISTSVVESRISLAPARLTGNETILVVEDEEAVRNLAKRILGAAGYTVLTAANGGEALLACEQHAEEIHLVLTDVVMPRMSGRVFVERIEKLCPRIKVLYMSGYTDNAIVHHGTLDSGTRFIGKPFNAAGLTRKVREVLDEPSPSPSKEADR